MKTALALRKPLEIKADTREMVRLWQLANEHAQQVVSLERRAAKPMIIAGAAFHLLKLQTSAGDWETTRAAHTKLSERTIQAWMQNVKALLAFVDWEPCEDAFRALIAERADDKRALALQTAVADALEGKTQRQLELSLGIRKPKASKPAPSADAPENPHNAVSGAVMALRDVSAEIQALNPDVITDQDRAELIDAAQAILNWLGAGE